MSIFVWNVLLKAWRVLSSDQEAQLIMKYLFKTHLKIVNLKTWKKAISLLCSREHRKNVYDAQELKAGWPMGQNSVKCKVLKVEMIKPSFSYLGQPDILKKEFFLKI